MTGYQIYDDGWHGTVGGVRMVNAEREVGV